jgi:RecA-family ATPase
LAEFDSGSIEEQVTKLRDCGFPISVIVTSGNRSAHGWVRVDAADRREWEARRDHVFTTLGCDPKNKDISRVSRLPGVTRVIDGVRKKQELVTVSIGPDRWPGGDALPEIEEVDAVLQAAQETPTPVIAGILYPGCKMVLGAPSKGRKSWALLDLALSCALGASWLGFLVTQGRVLYINFELKPWMLRQRLEAIAGDRGFNLARTKGQFDVWNLRGYSADFSTLVPLMIARINRLKLPYTLIVLDPIYKGLGERDENAAGDIGSLMNELERLCEKTKAALVVAHHFAKGDPWEKEPIDRLSGSGVFGRDPDALVILTGGRLVRGEKDRREGLVSKENKDSLFFVDTILRACPPIAQFTIRWQRYHFRRVDLILTYRLGSKPHKYAALFKNMPRLTKTSKADGADAESCALITWIVKETELPVAAAVSLFRDLRQPRYGLVICLGDGVWIGTNLLTKSQL